MGVYVITKSNSAEEAAAGRGEVVGYYDIEEAAEKICASMNDNENIDGIYDFKHMFIMGATSDSAQDLTPKSSLRNLYKYTVSFVKEDGKNNYLPSEVKFHGISALSYTEIARVKKVSSSVYIVTVGVPKRYYFTSEHYIGCPDVEEAAREMLRLYLAVNEKIVDATVHGDISYEYVVSFTEVKTSPTEKEYFPCHMQFTGIKERTGDYVVFNDYIKMPPTCSVIIQNDYKVESSDGEEKIWSVAKQKLSEYLS